MAHEKKTFHIEIISSVRGYLPEIIFFVCWVIAVYAFTGGGKSIVSWLNDWVQWDVHWYKSIWENGYPEIDPRALVFPPGFSIIAGSVSLFFGSSFALAASAVSLTSFGLGAMVAANYLASTFAVPRIQVFGLTLTSSTAYFAFAGYSDSMFFLVFWTLATIGTQPVVSKKLQVTELVLLSVAPWIRLTGYAFACWLLFRKYTAVAVGLSLALWLYFNDIKTGDPFYFLYSQELFAMPRGTFFDGFLGSLSGLLQPSTIGWISWSQFHFLPLVYFAMITLACVWAWRRGKKQLAVTCLGALMISHNQSFWRSVVRYDLLLMPLLYSQLLAESRYRTVFFIALSLSHFLLLVEFANLFRSGAWAF